MLVESIREEKRNLFKQGKLEEKFEIARTMLLKGLEIDFIAEITQLSKEEIEKLNLRNSVKCIITKENSVC